MQPVVNAEARWPCRLVVPTKMAKARCLEIEREDDEDGDREGEDHPDVGEGPQHPRGDTEYLRRGDLHTAALLAGKKALAPAPLTTLARTTIQAHCEGKLSVYEKGYHLDPETDRGGQHRAELVGGRPANGPTAEPTT